MSEFGWAYISGSSLNIGGPTNAVQVRKSADELTGSTNLTFNPSTNTLVLTGSFYISGSVSAREFNVDTTNKNITNLSVSGSSKFGDTSDDIHSFTGSLRVSQNVTASSYFGDGSNLTGINADTITSPLTVSYITGSTAVSGGIGVFGTVTAGSIIGDVTGVSSKVTVTDSSANTNFPVVFNDESNVLLDDTGTFTYNPSSATLSATNIAGAITTAAQTNITSVGTLSTLTVAGDVTVDTNSLKVDSSNNRVGIGRADPQRSLEVLKPDEAQVRLSYSKYQLGVSSNIYTDLETTSDGVFVISPTGDKTFLSGSIETSGSLTGSTMKLTGLVAGTATTSSYLALDSSNNIVLTSSSGGGESEGGTIGPAEDGSYADGLFADFTNSTTVGTAVDKFNEVLKILAPTPAPNLSLINADSKTGASAKLSFDGSNAISGYSSSATSAGFSIVARNGVYQYSSSANNLRLGVYVSHDITGSLNFNTAPSVTNNYMAYSSGAFGNAETGTLKLELNGATVHTVNLAAFAASGNPATGSASSLTSNSGFVNVSVSASSYDGNNAEWYIFKHRTAKYKISSTGHRKGWNYARVIHTVGSTNYITNYIEWISDPEGAAAALTATNPRIENIILRGSKYLSGIQYNTGSNANYKVALNNMYKNVYPSTTNTITFTVTNSSTPTAQSVPTLGGGDNNTKAIGVTGSLAVNVTSL